MWWQSCPVQLFKVRMKRMTNHKWGRIREKGKHRFVFLYGFLGWGFFTALLWAFIMEIVDPSENVWVRLVLALIIFPLAGIAFGHFTWNKAEKNYVKSSG